MADLPRLHPHGLARGRDQTRLRPRTPPCQPEGVCEGVRGPRTGDGEAHQMAQDVGFAAGN